ncbi:MAG: ECF transporter S component, partial [Bacillota bacterium]
GLIYRGNKSRSRAVIALSTGVVTMTAVMAVANLIVTPLFTGWPVSAVITVLPYIIGFNLIKAGVNAIITFFLYKRISAFLHK